MATTVRFILKSVVVNALWKHLSKVKRALILFGLYMISANVIVLDTLTAEKSQPKVDVLDRIPIYANE